MCRRITGNHADAADAAQDALIAIVRGLPRFDGRAAFGTWAYRVAANASLDELRRRRRRPQATIDGDRHHEVADRAADRALDDLATRLVDGPALDVALAGLPDDFRLPVVLRDVAELDYAEIASALAIPVGTVKSRIARGRAMLAHQLGVDPGNRGMTDRRRTEVP